jgi:hypothetical protein
MSDGNRWFLTITAGRHDGTFFLIDTLPGVTVHTREMLDSDIALVEIAFLVSREQAGELEYVLRATTSTEVDNQIANGA